MVSDFTKVDWLQIINVDRAVRDARNETGGDWYVDPWAWPELEYLGSNPDLLVEKMRTGSIHFERLTVPKTNYGERPASVVLADDRIALLGAFGRISAELEGSLPGHVYGWRLGNQEAGARPARNDQQWYAFVKSLYDAQDAPAVLATDITNFFASVPVDRAIEFVHRRVASGAAADYVELFLREHDSLSDRTGLPQRSVAMALLANAYLGPVDEVIAHSKASGVTSAARWMDDIWLFGRDGSDLRAAQVGVQRCLRTLGLEINLGKTRLEEGPASVRALVREFELDDEPPERQFARSGAPFAPQGDEADLDRQLEKFRATPEHADRTLINYICARLRQFDRAEEAHSYLEEIRRAPQGADYFGRLLHSLANPEPYLDWLSDLCASRLGKLMPWQTGQFLYRIPIESTDRTSDLALKLLETSDDPMLFAAAAARAARLNADNARYLLRNLADKSTKPLFRRVIALVLCGLGEETKRVEGILGEFRETYATLRWLRDVNFSCPPTRF